MTIVYIYALKTPIKHVIYNVKYHIIEKVIT